VLINLRSLLYNIAFYGVVVVYSIIGLPTLVMPRAICLAYAKFWAATSLVLLRAICGLRVELRGRERLPDGPLVIAAKHQSAWDTFALMVVFDRPVYVLKRELMWIPLFGWYLWKTGMIPVDRAKAASALIALIKRVSLAIKGGDQVIIFPEGTRRAPGAPPDYKPGVAMMYKEFGVPCVPLALNSGLFWPRRTFRRLPGTLVVEMLEPIPPGLNRKDFMARLERELEAGSARLLAEGLADLRARGLEPALPRDANEPA